MKNTPLTELKKDIEFYLHNIARYMPGCIYWKNKAGVYQGCSNYMLHESGLKSESELIGKTDHDIFPEKLAHLLHQNDLQVMKTGQPLMTEEVIDLPHKGKMTFVVAKIPLRNANGKITGIIGNSVNITQQKKLETELQTTKEKLERANQIKTQFIASMEHDLRAPAAGLAALTYTLENEETNPESKKKLKILASAAEQLLEVLNRILASNSAEDTNQPILERKFSLSKVIQNIANLENPVAQMKGLELNTVISPKIPQYIIGDDLRTYRILLNIVTNSIKFTDHGKVAIRANIAQKQGKEIIIKVEIIDTGSGISKDKQNILFEQFPNKETIDQQNRYTGSGMGLRLVKKFLDDIGGEIEVQSKPNKGSTFTCFIPFKLPLITSKTASETKHKAVCKDNHNLLLLHKVLLIEDDAIAQFIGRKMLETSFGCKVFLADTAAKALHLAKTKNFDIIFSDLELPDKSGEELAQELRKKGITVPIIALTAQGKSVKNDCLKAGMNDFVTKPVSFEQIKKLFKKWLPKSSHTVINASTHITTKKSKNQIINYEAALAVASRKDLAKKLFVKFITTLEKLEKDFNQAYKAKDAKKIIMLGHVTKGACRYCGAEKLEKTAAKLEKMKGQKVSWKELTKLYQNLMSDIKATQNELPKFL